MSPESEPTDPAAVQQQLVHGGSIADRSSHIWRLPLPADLEAGEHTAQVTATVTCKVDVADLAIPGLPGTRTITATASSPVDAYRERR